MLSYQETTKEVLKELLISSPKNPQKHFHRLYLKDKEMFGRLLYDENGGLPFSPVLDQILFDLKMSGRWG